MTSQWSLFGLDLSRAGVLLQRAWRDASRLKGFGWLRPQEWVEVRRPDGELLYMQGPGGAPLRERRPARARAVVLPEDICLVRSLRLPFLPAGELERAARLEIEARSPFPADSVVWGMRECAQGEGQAEHVLVFAQRSRVEAWLQTLEGAPAAPEVWAGEAGRLVALRGFGEGPRLGREARGEKGVLLLLCLLFAQLAVIAASPVLQERFRVVSALQQLAGLDAQTAETARQRSQLQRANARIGELQRRQAESAPMPLLLERLTHVLPDDTHLLRLEVEGRRVRFSGRTSNAAALLERLGQEAEFRDVTAPSGATRDRNTGKENFTIEFTFAAGGA